MELTRQRRLQQSEITIHLPLPLYLRSTLGVLLGFWIMVGGMRLLTRLTQPPPNPLYAYSHWLPGYRGSELTLSGLAYAEREVSKGHLGLKVETLRVQLPQTGPFERTGVVLLADRVITRVAFALRENTIKVGDLAAVWGKPVITSYTKVRKSPTYKTAWHFERRLTSFRRTRICASDFESWYNSHSAALSPRCSVRQIPVWSLSSARSTRWASVQEGITRYQHSPLVKQLWVHIRAADHHDPFDAPETPTDSSAAPPQPVPHW
jgi:hypothetical protein